MAISEAIVSALILKTVPVASAPKDVFTLAGFAIHDLFRRPALGMHDVSIHSRQAYRFNSAMAQRGQNVSIDLAGKYHFGHLQSRVVGNAPALDNCLLNTHHLSQVT